MAEYKISEDLAAIAKKVMHDHDNLKHLDDPRCRILYQYSSDQKKSGKKLVYADTQKVNNKFKHLMPYDFIITFYSPNTGILTEEQTEKLMYHELRHVGFEEGRFYIVPHDVEDFRDVIDMWGLDWI